jgi:DNA-binding ferritin-like protein (Dps family)
LTLTLGQPSILLAEPPRGTTAAASRRRQTMTTLIERIVGELGDKRRWRAYRARIRALPAGCRTPGEALERYLTYFGMITKGDIPTDVLMSMLEELADLFERAAAQGAPIRTVTGEDPVEFAETFFRNHVDGQWIGRQRDPSLSAIERAFHEEVEREINKERARLVNAVERADAQDRRSSS